jgi:hypothetical protein
MWQAGGSRRPGPGQQYDDFRESSILLTVSLRRRLR